MDNVDSRAQSAARSVRATVGRLEPPTLAPRRPSPSVLVVPVLLGIVGVIVSLRGSGGDDTSVVAASVGDTRLVPAELPEGLMLDDAWALPGPDGEGHVVQQVVYGAGDGDDPFSGGDLAVATIRFEGGLFPDGGERVEVRGQQAHLKELGSGATVVAWEEGGLLVEAQSHSLSDEQLVSAARALRLEGDRPVLPASAVPPGLVRLGEAEKGLGPSLVSTWAARGEGWLVEYSSSRARLKVVVSEGGPEQLAVAQWQQLGTDQRVLDVRGQRGVLGATAGEDGNQVTLVWLEAANTIVQVSALGLTEAQVVDIAQGLRPVTERDWRALEGQADDRSTKRDELRSAMTDAFDAEAQRGSSLMGASEVEGGWWIAYQEADPDGTGPRRYCVRTSQGGPNCIEPPQDPEPSAHLLGAGDQEWVVYGTLPIGTDALVLLLADGQRIDAKPSHNGRTLPFYVAPVPAGARLEGLDVQP